ncbi:ABC-type sulfate/molybdate transport systems ATPase subunit [Epilithonimonas hungarica]|jgi:ABC-type spermidine/putrescine transport systems, ATPase components|uniref:sulfate/molybdate ABC transporter ATP-binding protein n=1 Tax=Epilithonimonas hungarica TaxID=454006 RepID=UPI002787987E|nr:ABC transporter ATP-binding protein [Epilithonimonas hungarica]MDP9956101.1 ABC-type sulfate/molybdate transport systems ATPase subunit [Epilithonimonas hungarica]
MLLEVKNLYFNYQADKPLFQNLNLSVDEGQIIALAGESGCGKSTLLGLIYGLMDWQDGEIIFEGQKLFGPKGNLVPGEAQMKFVAQNYDLMPYGTVYDNVGKYISNINLKSKKEKVEELLDVVGLTEYAKVIPKNLSGGQQQRVAIARALAILPKMLLLDEPFSNLDFSRKFELRDKLFNYVRQNNMSLLISTHNLEEVLPWADKIVVLQQGRLIQNDSPKETYENPYNDYVAKLLGEVNIFSEEEKYQLNLKKTNYFPHQIKIAESGVEATVSDSRFAGPHYRNKLMINDKSIIVYTDAFLAGKVYLKF